MLKVSTCTAAYNTYLLRFTFFRECFFFSLERITLLWVHCLIGINSSATCNAHNHLNREFGSKAFYWREKCVVFFFGLKMISNNHGIREGVQEKKIESHFHFFFPLRHNMSVCLSICARAVDAYYASFFKFKIYENIPLFSFGRIFVLCRSCMIRFNVASLAHCHVAFNIGAHWRFKTQIFGESSTQKKRRFWNCSEAQTKPYHHNR